MAYSFINLVLENQVVVLNACTRIDQCPMTHVPYYSSHESVGVFVFSEIAYGQMPHQ